MQPYLEQAAQLAEKSSVAVQVLLGDAPGDCEFIALRPRAANPDMWAEIRSRWQGRGLRSIGIIGLVGTSPRVVLKEPIESEQVSALANAFLIYLHSLFHDSFAAQIAAAETAEIPDFEPEYDWHSKQYRLVPRGN